MLSQLRDLQEIVAEEVDKMDLIFDIEKDVRYRQGREKGLKEGLLQGIEALLEVKYGTDGIMLIDKIRTLNTIDDLEGLKNLIRTSASIEQIKEHLSKN
ncbi:hypothetical protein MCHI_000750 [Candidatus Magnetoovum chiemensis]|nr:hypothetical protein MCHI_000750 [Candidatus Magnetoovum chiemensis]